MAAVEEPGLFWGVKASFVDYVLDSVGDGRIQVAAGAGECVEQRRFRFPPAAAEGSEISEVLRFVGEVRLTGYLGVLDVRIADPWLHRSDDRVELTVADDDPLGDGRLVVASGRPEPTGVEGQFVAELALAESALRLFAERFPAGEPLAPVAWGTSVSPTEGFDA